MFFFDLLDWPCGDNSRPCFWLKEKSKRKKAFKKAACEEGRNRLSHAAFATLLCRSKCSSCLANRTQTRHRCRNFMKLWWCQLPASTSLTNLIRFEFQLLCSQDQRWATSFMILLRRFSSCGELAASATCLYCDLVADDIMMYDHRCFYSEFDFIVATFVLTGPKLWLIPALLQQSLGFRMFAAMLKVPEDDV